MLINEFLENSANLLPEKIALVCRAGRYTYSEIDRTANSVGNALLNAGFQKQQRAIIYLENSAESVISLFGILKAGGVFVVLDTQVKSKKLESILENSEASVLITSQALFQRVSEITEKAASLKTIILTDGEESSFQNKNGGAKRIPFNGILKQSPAIRPPATCIDIDLASLIYTSGSTGTPKGVTLTHLNMVSAATSITTYLGNTPDDIILDTLPLAFDYGLYQVLMAFKFGGRVILEKGFVYPQQVVNLAVKEKITGWPVVPTMAAILLRLNDLNKQDFSGLRYITSTGQAMPPRHLEMLQRTFPTAKIFSMYGLTECKRVSYLPPEDLLRKPGAVGKAMPNTEVFLVDENNQVIDTPEREGELVVRGANVMKGYWKMPVETARALRPGRYPGEMALYTGDVFKKDEEGYLYFVGRKDDIIKTAGHMVSPREVENVLCEKEDVAEAAVVRDADEILGKTVHAYVALTGDSKSNERDIISFCSERLEDFAVPRRVTLLESLPKSENGKVLKQALANYDERKLKDAVR